MEWNSAPNDLCEYRVGDRVELHPATDRWMMGDRFGEVAKIGRRFLHLKMERSGQTIRTTPGNIHQIQERG